MSIPSLSWMPHGLCRSEDQAWFFGPDGEAPHRKALREARAVAVCRRCPVVRPCGEYAVTRPEQSGVWGGMTEYERALARRRWLRSQGRAA